MIYTVLQQVNICPSSVLSHIFACASKKWQNNQRIDGGRILVEVEAYN